MSKRRLYLWLQTLLCFALGAALITGVLRVYWQDGGYSSDTVAEVLRFARPLALVLGVFSICGLLAGVKAGQQKPSAQKAPVVKPPSHAAAIRIALLTASLLLIIYGIINGSLRDVLYKAIQICSECIGLG